MSCQSHECGSVRVALAMVLTPQVRPRHSCRPAGSVPAASVRDPACEVRAPLQEVVFAALHEPCRSQPVPADSSTQPRSPDHQVALDAMRRSGRSGPLVFQSPSRVIDMYMLGVFRAHAQLKKTLHVLRRRLLSAHGSFVPIRSTARYRGIQNPMDNKRHLNSQHLQTRRSSTRGRCGYPFGSPLYYAEGV